MDNLFLNTYKNGKYNHNDRINNTCTRCDKKIGSYLEHKGCILCMKCVYILDHYYNTDHFDSEDWIKSEMDEF